MAKKKIVPTGSPETPVAPASPVTLQYIGPPDEDSPRYGALVPGRSYQESDATFASYLVTTHPDHWIYGD